MDATLKGIPLNKQKLEEVFSEIFNIDVQDGVTFKLIGIKDIRLEDEYGGYRLNILSKLDYNKTYITVELTTGDEITPREMKYSYNCIFEDKKISIMAYNLETILAEKFHAVISRGILNTRLKDFYDIYTLMNTKIIEFNKNFLVKAIQNTFKRRETDFDITFFHEVLNDLIDDNNMINMWREYINKNLYAQDIKFKDTINAIKNMVDILEQELVEV